MPLRRAMTAVVDARSASWGASGGATAAGRDVDKNMTTMDLLHHE
jgi:hypothetical protein